MRTSLINSLPEVRRNRWRRRAKKWLCFRPTCFAQPPQHSLGKRLQLPKWKASFRPHCDSPFAHTQRAPSATEMTRQKRHRTRLVSCKRRNYHYHQSAHFDKSAWKALILIWIPRPGSPESPIWFVLINHLELTQKKHPFRCLDPRFSPSFHLLLSACSCVVCKCCSNRLLVFMYFFIRNELCECNLVFSLVQ